jgi:EAL domain-containing protein (putative c-di-GMP-specific phosphodiesterase class I)
VPTDTHDAAMVRAMITLARDLDLRIVAEGIETEAQLAFLNQLRCDEDGIEGARETEDVCCSIREYPLN